MLQGILDGACATVEARYGFAVLFDDSGAPAETANAGLTAAEQLSGERWGPENTERLMSHLRGLDGPLRVADWPAHLRSLGIDAGGIVGRNGIAAPMDFAGRRYGCLLTGDSRSGKPFTGTHARTVHLYAGQAAATAAFALMQRAERTAREEADAMLEAAPTALFVLHPEGSGRQPLANRSAKRLVAGLMDEGQSMEAFLESASLRLASDQRKVEAEDALTGQELWAEEAEVSTPDGRSIQVLASMSPVRSPSGGTASAVVALQDLAPLAETERRRTEFLGLVSHELRVPLTSIMGSAAMLLDESEGLGAAERREFFRLIAEQAGRMRGLIADLLDVGRIDAGTLSVSPLPTEAADLVERARSAFLAGDAGRSVAVDLEAGLPPVMADRRRIAQVLNNLLANAARHTVPSAVIRVAAVRAGRDLAFSVADDGAGVAPEALPRLFQRHGAGTAGHGLGLAVCKGLVEAHGGRIRAESDGPGRGTTVTFTLPAAEAGAAATKRARASSSSPPGERPRILVVDDDPNTLRLVRDALEGAGYAPLVTGVPDDLAGLLRAERPALVLLDLLLPGRDGLQLFEEVPELSDQPLVFISGNGRDETVAKAFELGADDYIVKPFSATELAARVRAALRRHREPQPFTLGGLAIRYDSCEVTVRDEPVDLTATEYELLRLLSVNAGRVVRHETLLRRLWDGRSEADINLVRIAVGRLRRKLGDSAGDPAWIFSRRGVGYRMPRPGGD